MGSAERRTLGEGRFLRLVRKGNWEYVERRGIRGIVGIVAVSDQGNLLLVEQHRPPVDARVIELPAGLCGDDDAKESLASAATRELLEETGYRAKRMTRLTEGVVSAGMSDEVVTLFLAEELSCEGPALGDGHERITLHEVPVGQVEQWLTQRQAEGILVDLKVYGALHYLRNRC